jgi:hypothetical protein
MPFKKKLYHLQTFDPKLASHLEELILQFHMKDPKPCNPSLLHIVPFCEGPNKKPEGFVKEKQKT